MYYSNGNYEAFANPEKPAGVARKKAYLIGAGLASMAAAAFLLRDGGMSGENIHIFEELDLPGGSCDGLYNDGIGFVTRGGREMENHFECLWELFRSVPSLEVKDASVLDEFYRLNKHDPNYSLQRAIIKCGQDAHTDGKFTLTPAARREIVDLVLTPEKELDDKRINQVFSADFFASNFWLYWSTMFAFETWHSAMEMRRYLCRFIHHIGGLPDFSCLKFTKYNQYESLILPLQKYLTAHGVQITYGVTVENITFKNADKHKSVQKIIYRRHGKINNLVLTADDLVFITNGSNTESSTLGTHKTAAPFNRDPGGSWQLWQNIAKQDPDFGRPEKFFGNIEESNWLSATATTLDDKIPPFIEKICHRNPLSGKVVTGGIVSVRDSNWLLSFTVNRQPHFKRQPQDKVVVWIYALLSNTPGNYVKKAMRACSGEEIAAEWLYHMGVPHSDIASLAAKSVNCIPCMMPYVTAYFMPRAGGDRPQVVPPGSRNFAFIGNFAETKRDVVFTTEYSVRTAMEAVYTLLNIDRGVPEVFASIYDIRMLLFSASKLLDGENLATAQSGWLQKIIFALLEKKISSTVIADLLKEYKLL